MSINGLNAGGRARPPAGWNPPQALSHFPSRRAARNPGLVPSSRQVSGIPPAGCDLGAAFPSLTLMNALGRGALWPGRLLRGSWP